MKKQYRKLALQYHPDRNAGKEEEYIPKFQAIQAAHEILGEPGEKSRYDGDRRKAGLFPTSGFSSSTAGGGGTRGNPYQATSAYPPPPRRTQPGTYQRPQTGADRFSNFPRQAPTAKRADPAADRQNAFKAWQNMNNAQDRQQQQSRFPSGATPQPKTASPRRPAPPPRADPKFPSDEKIRAGFSYREAPHPTGAADKAEERQSAWAAFQKSHANANSPGVKRSNTNKASKKQGFDPNLPGSDEGPAPDSQYAHRHKSADFGRPYPPPPPPPRPSQPESPMSTPQRPHADPLRPFKTRTGDEDAPYSEGNRIRTPYSSFSGERTDFGSDMRRSNSTRDTSKMNAEANTSRARSTSPLRRPSATKSDHSQNSGRPNPQRPSFSVGGSSSTSAESSEPENTESPFAQSTKSAVPPQNRPKIVPSPPSRRFNGSTNPTSPPGPSGMGQKTNSNMYVNTNPLSREEHQRPPFSLAQWASRMFGSSSTGEAGQRNSPIPKWAVPASVLPQRKSSMRPAVEQLGNGMSSSKFAGIQTIDGEALTRDEKSAYWCFKQSLNVVHSPLPESLDIDVFLRLASTARSRKSSGVNLVDETMNDTLRLYPSVGYRQIGKDMHANSALPSDSFSFPTSPDLFSPTANSKSRSEENINTAFSPNGWTGTFSGSADYFAPPQQRRGSPSVRGGQRPGVRTATSNYAQSPSAAQSPTATMPPPPRPHATQSEEAPAAQQGAEGDTKFSKDQWEQTFKDASWTWPPPPPMAPTSPVKGGAKSRQASRKNSRSQTKSTSGTATNPHVVNEEDDQTINPPKANQSASAEPVHESDAMDIDNTPPATEHPGKQQGHADPQKEPRLVSVPPSAWRQSQQQHPAPNTHHRATSSGSGNVPLRANLNDLANVAPFSESTDGSSLHNLNSMSATLPFPSQAANTLPTNPHKPQTLSTPVVPIPPKAPSRLSKASWHQYAQNFGVYLLAFNSFNNAMLQHFQARDQQAAARMQTGMAWLEATGDATVGGGFGTFAREVKEDERVRETWNMGCERHADSVKEFDEVRERVRRLAVAGTIVDS